METIKDVLDEMRRGMIPKHRHDRELLLNFADRIEAASKAYNKEVTELLREVIAGVCLHCDMQSTCQEGEDGMPTTCNAVAKARRFIEQHSEPELNNDEYPF